MDRFPPVSSEEPDMSDRGTAATVGSRSVLTRCQALQLVTESPLGPSSTNFSLSHQNPSSIDSPTPPLLRTNLVQRRRAGLPREGPDLPVVSAALFGLLQPDGNGRLGGAP